MEPENIYSFPTNIQTNQELIADAIDLGCLRAKIVPTNSISLGSWIHLQCQFGCSNYGNILTCPPYTPSSNEMSEFLMEYKKALLIEVDDSTDTNNMIVKLEERFKKTGLQFCGLIMADHSKCGINTMFNTGTVVGVSSNIFGSGFSRNFIPSFSWGGNSGFTTYKTNKVFEVAEIVMKRRNIEFTDTDKSILEKVFELTSKYRNY